MSERSERAWTAAGLDAAASAALTDGLPASKLWSLLLEVLTARAERRTPAALLDQWQRDAFTRPTSIDQRTLVALDAHLLAAAAGFEAIELSPLAPLGSCSAVGLASQNKIVSALRGTEVVADPTNVMALECARRLRRTASAIVRLATCQRVVRAQEVPRQSGFSQHFRIFCLATAGLEQAENRVVIDAVREQIATMLAALDRLEQHGYLFADRRVSVLATSERAAIADRIAAAIQPAGAGVVVTRDELRHPYYDGIRFQINARSASGIEAPLIDGGCFDWVGKLAANRRLVFVASGMGSELVAKVYRSAT